MSTASTLTPEQRVLKVRAATARWRATPRGAESARRSARERGARITALKAGPCTDCGGTFPPECMDFDHVHGPKARELSRMNTYSLSAVLAEVAKCELVCSNCHRTRTHKRRAARV